MQREYGLAPRQIREYTMRELVALHDDYTAVLKQREADRLGVTDGT
jgi:hypothetical protein